MVVTTATGSRRTLVSAKGERAEVSVEDVLRRLAAGDESRFWLDIEHPSEADYDLLLNGFHFHPLTIEDVQHQNQRPKLEQYPGYTFVVLFAAQCEGDELALREHHLYHCDQWLVSVHQEPAPELDQLRQRLDSSPDLTRGDVGFLQYLVVDSLVQGLFPTLDALDETIDQLVDGMVNDPAPAMLGRLVQLKHDVTDLRRILGPQRDVFQRLLTHSLDHAGGELTLYWRDVHDHIIRQYESVDSLRDLLTGAMDVYLSTVSNRLNATMKQLTVIASVFLPLTFATGFFGMNFAVLVANITSRFALALGIGLMAASVVVQLTLFRRRGWI
jgi:magnesium transporter